MEALFSAFLQTLLSFWPSTPDALKLSHVLAGLMGAWPSAPWFLLGNLMSTLAWVVPTVAIVKVIQTVKP